MLELTTTRANHEVDPVLAVWRWEIPVDLFFASVVAGMMIIGGLNLWRATHGAQRERAWTAQTPLLALALLHVCLLMLLLDMSHKLYAWNVYLAFRPTSPMSWGSWIISIVYVLLIASSLVRLSERWPWLASRLPAIVRASDWLTARASRMRVLAALNVVFGVALGLYTGVLLSTMVARPLWNSAALAPLFLASGLAGGAAMMRLAAALVPLEAPLTPVGGALAALVQPIEAGGAVRDSANVLKLWTVVPLAAAAVLTVLLLIGLSTASASHVAAARLLIDGPYALMFWTLVVGVGFLLPFVLFRFEASRRLAWTFAPYALVLVGGFALRWVIVGAGQMSELLHTAGY